MRAVDLAGLHPARMIAGGDLARLVEDDGLTGVTSNPSIFEKAIDGSDDYTAPYRGYRERRRRLRRARRSTSAWR